jgi:hypothetical protein
MLLARMPAKDGAVFGIPDAGDLVGAAEPLGLAHGSGDREILCCSPVRAERNRYGEARVGTEKLNVRKTQPTIAMSATKFSVTLMLLLEPVAGMRLPLP